MLQVMFSTKNDLVVKMNALPQLSASLSATLIKAFTLSPAVHLSISLYLSLSLSLAHAFRLSTYLHVSVIFPLAASSPTYSPWQTDSTDALQHRTFATTLNSNDSHPR